MSETLYSHRVTFANVPEVTEFTAKFNYNFYTKRETSTVESEINLVENNSVVISGSPHPRDTQLIWKISIKPDQVWTDNRFGINPLFVQSNREKIIFEGAIPSSRYTSVNLDNSSLPNKVLNLIEVRKILEQNKVTDLREIGISDEFSEIDLSQPILTSEQIGESSMFRYGFYSSPMMERLINLSRNDSLSQFDNELNSVLNFYSLRGLNNSSELVPIPSIQSSRFPPERTFLLLGFLISRYLIDQSGSELEKKDFFVNQGAREFFDKTVIYGRSYSYEIRSVYQVVVPSVIQSGGIAYLTTLVASKPVRSYVVAEETEPPPPPDHIKFLWDYLQNKLEITWNMPYNPQRDIKRFQIFRRESTQNAFELIHEIRFNDNISPEFISGIPENVPDNLWVKSQYTDYPEKIYQDPDFTKESRYIYALCSIDARYYTSGYSEQFEVYYDKIRNKLSFKQISPAGAPKPYPNLYLKDEDIVQTSLSVSGIKSKRMNLIFSPQFYKCKSGNSPLPSPRVMKSTLGKYNFHILNTDNQKDAIVEISIKDVNNIID